MEKESRIKELQNYGIQHLRIKAREYGITPSTKKRTELIEEITECILENKKKTQSGRGRKPKNNVPTENIQKQKPTQEDVEKKQKAIDNLIYKYQKLKNQEIELLKELFSTIIE